MYRCYNIKRFFRLLLLDVIIFTIISSFIGISRQFIFSSAGYNDERIFLPVIMYHSIHESSATEYAVTPQQIESDLKYLKEHGYNSVSAQQLADYNTAEENSPKILL